MRGGKIAELSSNQDVLFGPSVDSGLRRQVRWLAFGAWLLLGLGYALLFWGFSGQGILPALKRALINTLPAALLSLLVVKLTETYLLGRSLRTQGVSHFVLALGFGVLWYIGIQVGYGLQNGWATTGLAPRPLNGIALTWQAFQGGAVYAAIIGFFYAVHFWFALVKANHLITRLEAAQTYSHQSASASSPTQVMVKDGRALKPVSVSDILALSGAGDYTEVITKSARYLSNTSLNAFETELPTRDFARVHRSHIIRMDAVLSVESAGNGRLTLHLPAGLSITTSRAGAQLIKHSAL